MAYPCSPEVGGAEGGSGLDHLIKNTEFENIQHTKAIETERERIKAYKLQLEEKRRQTVELGESTGALDEHAKKLHKQFAFNQENFESLKHTSTVLADHEEALKRKLSSLQVEVDKQRSEQSNALSKYEAVWASYQAKYESMEKSKLLKKRRQELYSKQEQNTQLENQIRNLEQTIETMKQNTGMKSLRSWVLQIATLRVEALHCRNTLHAEMATARNLRHEIDGLELKIADTQALLEKREMEAKEALQIQDVVAMETDVPRSAPNVSDLSPPNEASAQSDNTSPPSSSSLPSSRVPTVPILNVAPSVAKLQVPSFLQPRPRDESRASFPTQANSNTDTGQCGLQKKSSRLFFQMPQLSTPKRSAVTSGQSITPPSTPRNQIPSVLPNGSGTRQRLASSQRRPAAQIQMPTLLTPSRTRLAPFSQPSSDTATPSQGNSARFLETPKPSLQIKVPAMVQLSRLPSMCTVRPTSEATEDVQPQSHVGGLCKSTAVTCTSQPDSNTASPTTLQASSPQETCTVEKSSRDEVIQEYTQDDDKLAPIENEGEVPNPSAPFETNSGDQPSAIYIPEVATPTTLHQMEGDIINANSTAGGVDASQSDHSAFSQQDGNQLNLPVSQEMSDLQADNSQGQAEEVSMFGSDLYQQQDGQDSAFSGQFFDGGMSAFGQTDGGFGFGGGGFSGGDFGGNDFAGGGLFTGQGSSAGGEGFFFGGPPTTSQQQQQTDTNGFGFSFGGDSTTANSNSFTFNF